MLKTRIITAVVLAACFIFALFNQPANPYWTYAWLAVSLIAVYEWGSIAKLNPTQRAIYVGFAAVAGVIMAQWMLHILDKVGYTALMGRVGILFYVAAAFWIIIVPIWLNTKMVIKSKLVMCALGLLLILSIWLALVFAKIINPTCLLTLLGTIWIADSAAYFTGKKFGKHKLAPTISPGKTWEGVAGALAGVTILGLVLHFYFGVYNAPLIFGGLWAIAILGVMGDLFESMMKRQANIKDSGSILPGHGGILDRIDGIIPSLPIAVLVIFSFYADSFTH
jgi:phosphatidate cytidylyltransferase